MEIHKIESFIKEFVHHFGDDADAIMVRVYQLADRFGIRPSQLIKLLPDPQIKQSLEVMYHNISREKLEFYELYHPNDDSLFNGIREDFIPVSARKKYWDWCAKLQKLWVLVDPEEEFIVAAASPLPDFVNEVLTPAERTEYLNNRGKWEKSAKDFFANYENHLVEITSRPFVTLPAPRRTAPRAKGTRGASTRSSKKSGDSGGDGEDPDPERRQKQHLHLASAGGAQ